MIYVPAILGCPPQVSGNRTINMPMSVTVDILTSLDLAHIVTLQLLRLISATAVTPLQAALQAQDKAPVLPQSESELLLKIDWDIPPDIQQHFNEKD